VQRERRGDERPQRARLDGVLVTQDAAGRQREGAPEGGERDQGQRRDGSEGGTAESAGDGGHFRLADEDDGDDLRGEHARQPREAAAETAADEAESRLGVASIAETEPEPVVELEGGADDRPDEVEPVVDLAPATEGSEEPPMGTAPGEPGTEADFEDEEQAPPA